MYRLTREFDTIEEAVEFVCPFYTGDCPLWWGVYDMDCGTCWDMKQSGNYALLEDALLKVEGWEKVGE